MTAAHFGENMGWFVVGLSLFACQLPNESVKILFSRASAVRRDLQRPSSSGPLPPHPHHEIYGSSHAARRVCAPAPIVGAGDQVLLQ